MIDKRVDIVTQSRKEYRHLNNPNSKYNVSDNQYRKICCDFFEELAYLLITTGDIIVLPATLGAIQAIKYKKNLTSKSKSLDWKMTKKHNKKIYHTNMSTGGYWCRIHWYRIPKNNRKVGARFKNAKFFSFALTRPNVRVNTYNKVNPRVNLYDFFRDKGWQIYKLKDYTI